MPKFYPCIIKISLILMINASDIDFIWTYIDNNSTILSSFYYRQLKYWII